MAETNELGTVLCKHCGAIVATLPTRGVKRFYTECGKCRGGKSERKNKGGCGNAEQVGI